MKSPLLCAGLIREGTNPNPWRVYPQSVANPAWLMLFSSVRRVRSQPYRSLYTIKYIGSPYSTLNGSETTSHAALRPGQLNALRMHTAAGCFKRSSAKLCGRRKHTYLLANYIGRKFGVRLDLSTSGLWTNFMSDVLLTLVELGESHFLAVGGYFIYAGGAFGAAVKCLKLNF